jgi:hypothetical protein
MQPVIMAAVTFCPSTTLQRRKNHETRRDQGNRLTAQHQGEQDEKSRTGQVNSTGRKQCGVF